MHIEEAFTFCPRCGNKLTPHTVGGFPICSHCGLHFYTNPKPCTTVIIFDNNGSILLTKRGIEPHKGKWDLPGGFTVPNESIIDSAKREIREELNVEIEVDRILDSLPDEYEYQGIVYITLPTIMTAHIISGTLKAQDDVVGFSFFTPEEALKLDLSFRTVAEAIRMIIDLK